MNKGKQLCPTKYYVDFFNQPSFKRFGSEDSETPDKGGGGSVFKR